MYNRPPLYAVATIVLPTTFVAIIAPPGANRHIRIVAYAVAVTRTATGVVDVSLTDTPGVLSYGFGGALSAAGMSMFGHHIPEPGIHLPVNTGLSFTQASTTAVGGARGQVWYYIDDVT